MSDDPLIAYPRCPVCGSTVGLANDTLRCNAEWEHWWMPLDVLEHETARLAFLEPSLAAGHSGESERL